MPTLPYIPPPPGTFGVPTPNSDNRKPYTGTFTEQPQTPMVGNSPAPNTANSSQLPGHFGGYQGPAPAYVGDAPGTNPQAPLNQTNQAIANYNTQVAGVGGNYLGPLSSPFSELGGNRNDYTGDKARALNDQLQMQAYGASQRGPAQINMAPTNMFASGAGNALGQANGTNLLGVRQGLDLAGLANGQGVQGQFGSADRLMGMSQMPAGPSVAQQQLAMGQEANMRQQMAMAAGARGGNAGLALQNAGANAGAANAQLGGQQALLRAQEDMANRQFAANAAQAAGGMYGQAASTQANAIGGAGQLFGGIAGNQVNQANTNVGLANTYAGMAGADLNAAMGQRQLNDQTMMGSQALGYKALTDQRAAEQGYALDQQHQLGDLYKSNVASQTAMALQDDSQANDWLKAIVAGGATALGAAGGFMLGGPAGAAAGGSLGYSAGQAVNSDIRAKKNIAPADGDVSDAFRALNGQAEAIRNTKIDYPGADSPAYSYEYKNPMAPGSAPGTHYGPMAQDFERTPAGASVVVNKPDGMKGIDTDRLSIMSASELAKQRAEIDALMAAKNLTVDKRAPSATQLSATGAGFGRFGTPTEVQGYNPQHAPLQYDTNMRVRGIDSRGNPFLAPVDTLRPNPGPSIGFQPGQMGYNLG